MEQPVDPPPVAVLEPRAVATWLHVDDEWVAQAIADGLPVLGYRSDGTPLLAADEIRAWLRRPSPLDDAT
jgi:hypothetical protein